VQEPFLHGALLAHHPATIKSSPATALGSSRQVSRWSTSNALAAAAVVAVAAVVRQQQFAALVVAVHQQSSPAVGYLLQCVGPLKP
jgi:hypothetical protein